MDQETVRLAYNARLRHYRQQTWHSESESGYARCLQLSYDYRFLRPLLLKKRESKCELCGFPKSPLDIHHKRYALKGKDLSLCGDESNVLLVCNSCHSAIHKWKRLASNRHIIFPQWVRNSDGDKIRIKDEYFG
jgi:hypothetical protein